jgi:hypothetical protein
VRRPNAPAPKLIAVGGAPIRRPLTAEEQVGYESSTTEMRNRRVIRGGPPRFVESMNRRGENSPPTVDPRFYGSTTGFEETLAGLQRERDRIDANVASISGSQITVSGDRINLTDAHQENYWRTLLGMYNKGILQSGGYGYYSMQVPPKAALPDDVPMPIEGALDAIYDRLAQWLDVPENRSTADEWVAASLCPLAVAYPRGTAHGFGLNSDKSLIWHSNVAKRVVDAGFDADVAIPWVNGLGLSADWVGYAAYSRTGPAKAIPIVSGTGLNLFVSGMTERVQAFERLVNGLTTYYNNALMTGVRPIVELFKHALMGIYKHGAPTLMHEDFFPRDLQPNDAFVIGRRTNSDKVFAVLGMDFSGFDRSIRLGTLDLVGLFYERVLVLLGWAPQRARQWRELRAKAIRLPLIAPGYRDGRMYHGVTDSLMSGIADTSLTGSLVNIAVNLLLAQAETGSSLRSLLLVMNDDWTLKVLGDDSARVTSWTPMDAAGIANFLEQFGLAGTDEAMWMLSTRVTSVGAGREVERAILRSCLRESPWTSEDAAALGLEGNLSTLHASDHSTYLSAMSEYGPSVARELAALSPRALAYRAEVAARRVPQNNVITLLRKMRADMDNGLPLSAFPASLRLLFERYVTEIVSGPRPLLSDAQLRTLLTPADLM